MTQPAKGTRDFLPDDIRRRRHVTDVIQQVYQAHGFEPLETPAFERLETLLGKYGDEGDQLLFKILLRGEPLVGGIRQAAEMLPEVLVRGRSGETAPRTETVLSDLGLRYDLTVPLARVVAEYQGKLPPVFKRYQIQPVWRADTPGKGRFREFYQCDVDIVGSPSRMVEAEVAGAVSDCMRRLGFEKFDILFNHRALLSAIVERCGITPEAAAAAIVAVDKLDKIGADGVLAELASKGVSDESGRNLLDTVRGRPSIAELGARMGGAGASALAELAEVAELSKDTPAGEHMIFDPALARGLGYYTGCIFEIAVPDLAGSLGGGGRYDGLIGMFLGREVPACGFSIGLERIIVVMEQRGMFPAGLTGIDVTVAAADPSRLQDALRLAYRLRGAGLQVDLVPGTEKPGKLRKRTDERGIPHAVWLERDKPDAAFLWSRSNRDVASAEVTIGELASHLRKTSE